MDGFFGGDGDGDVCRFWWKGLIEFLGDFLVEIEFYLLIFICFFINFVFVMDVYKVLGLGIVFIMGEFVLLC